jgi:hypothetical protein
MGKIGRSYFAPGKDGSYLRSDSVPERDSAGADAVIGGLIGLVAFLALVGWLLTKL